MRFDGRLDEAFWSSIRPIELKPFGGPARPGTTVRVAATANRLLVGAHLEDDHVWSSLDSRDADLWNEEVFEWFVDPDGDGENYLEFQINPRGAIFDANFKNRLGTGKGSRREQIERAREFDLPDLEHAVHVDGTLARSRSSDTEASGWSVELAVPFESLPGVDGPPLTEDWAVNFYRFERPPSGGTRAFAWDTRPSGDFHQVSKFGVLKFDIPTEALQMIPGGSGGEGTKNKPAKGETTENESGSEIDTSVLEPLQLDETLPESLQ